MAVPPRITLACTGASAIHLTNTLTLAQGGAVPPSGRA